VLSFLSSSERPIRIWPLDALQLHLHCTPKITKITTLMRKNIMSVTVNRKDMQTMASLLA